MKLERFRLSLALASAISVLPTAVSFTHPPTVCKCKNEVNIRRSNGTSKKNHHIAPPSPLRLGNIGDESIWNHEENRNQKHSQKDEQRRKAILGVGGAASSCFPFLFGNHEQKSNTVAAAAATNVYDTNTPVADFPMRRLRLPKGGLGRGYIIIQLYIEGKGPYDFMVDSGLTTELITPHLQQALHLDKNSGITKQGLSAGSVSQTQSIIELNNVSLCCGTFASGESIFPLPGPLNAIVTDFPQEHMDPAHDPVEGMIGMEVLEQFDVDFDFPAGRLRLWKPHTVESVAKKAGMATIDAVVVNETRLLGFRVISSSAQKDSNGGLAAQPFLGVVDCGASFSVVNWAAAPLLGLPPQNDGAYTKSPMVTGLGVDGRPLLMPTATMGLSYCGNPKKGSTSTTMAFEAPPSDFKPWNPISIAIGDLPVFSQLLGDGRTPYRGPAGIIGLDILTQRRFMLETGAGRQRRIYLGMQ